MVEVGVWRERKMEGRKVIKTIVTFRERKKSCDILDRKGNSASRTAIKLLSQFRIYQKTLLTGSLTLPEETKYFTMLFALYLIIVPLGFHFRGGVGVYVRVCVCIYVCMCVCSMMCVVWCM